MNNIEQLANALRMCDINATVFTSTALSLDGKSHRCIFLSTDFWTGEDSLEFIFHPDTGKRVDSVRDCPLVVEKKNKKEVDK